MSHSQLKQLIKMINQIALNNHYENDDEKTALFVQDHINKFWAVSMKQQIKQYAEQDGSELVKAVKLSLSLPLS